MRSIVERLQVNSYTELERLLQCFESGCMPIFAVGMERHFKIAKTKPEAFKNHAPVLAFSLGGTNTELMIAKTQKGEFVVEYFRALKNPAEPIDFFDYMDKFLVEDYSISRYMRESESPVIGFSVPLGLYNGAPYSATKLPTIDNLVARKIEDIPYMHLGRKMAAYLRKRNFGRTVFFYQADGIVAHHGAVSVSSIDPHDKSVLTICGTGLSGADEDNYIQPGILRLLDGDEELYPEAATESYQLQYAAAGKGLFALMNRAVELEARDVASPLYGVNLTGYFSGVYDSKTVVELWESTLGPTKSEAVIAIRDFCGEKAYVLLTQIASAIVDRAASSIANCVAAAVAQMGQAANQKPHHVFLEGSIALNRHIKPMVIQKINAALSQRPLFEKYGFQAPIVPILTEPLSHVRAGEQLDKELVAEVDLSLIGAASTAMAQEIILRGASSHEA